MYDSSLLHNHSASREKIPNLSGLNMHPAPFFSLDRIHLFLFNHLIANISQEAPFEGEKWTSSKRQR
jgi:hypothetical protein